MRCFLRGDTGRVKVERRGKWGEQYLDTGRVAIKLKRRIIAPVTLSVISPLRTFDHPSANSAYESQTWNFSFLGSGFFGQDKRWRQAKQPGNKAFCETTLTVELMPTFGPDGKANALRR